jgi:hypothetical protein
MASITPFPQSRVYNLATSRAFNLSSAEMGTIYKFLAHPDFQAYVGSPSDKLTTTMLSSCKLCQSTLIDALGWRSHIEGRLPSGQSINDVVLPKLFKKMIQLWPVDNGVILAAARAATTSAGRHEFSSEVAVDGEGGREEGNLTSGHVNNGEMATDNTSGAGQELPGGESREPVFKYKDNAQVLDGDLCRQILGCMCIYC